ncbi:MAG: hypothetical protein ACPGVY_15110 [Mycobacterium sp.]
MEWLIYVVQLVIGAGYGWSMFALGFRRGERAATKDLLPGVLSVNRRVHDAYWKGRGHGFQRGLDAWGDTRRDNVARISELEMN